MRYVVAQFVVMAGIVVCWFLPPRSDHPLLGAALAIAGALLFAWSARALGRALTPVPKPRGPLVTSGPYRFLRHPMYVGGVLFFAGVSLAFSWTAVVATALLAGVWAAKARVEEGYLAELPGYVESRRRTVL